MMKRLAPDLMPVEQMIEMTVEWLVGGGVSLHKPTMFERTDGKY